MLQSLWQDAKQQFQKGDIITQLIFINVGVFVMVHLIGFMMLPFTGIGENNAHYAQKLLNWLEVPSDPLKLLTRPWTVVTYMFLHVEIYHILFNMLYLYWFGNILRNYLGDRRILPIYIIGGLAGFLVFFLIANFAPNRISEYVNGQMLGASAGVMAILVAAATIAPRHTISLLFIGAIELRYIALFSILLDMIAIKSGSNSGGHLAHLGGVAAGYFFTQQLKKGNDWSIFFDKISDQLSEYFRRFSYWLLRSAASSDGRKVGGNGKGPRMGYRNPNPTAQDGSRFSTSSKGKPSSDTDISHQERIDLILDKIKAGGYASLTPEEKEFLFRASKH